MAAVKTKYTPRLDLLILREVINHNPFVDPQKWKIIVDSLQDVEDNEGAPTTARSVRERVTLLMEYFRKDQMAKINRHVMTHIMYLNILGIFVLIDHNFDSCFDQ